MPNHAIIGSIVAVVLLIIRLVFAFAIASKIEGAAASKYGGSMYLLCAMLCLVFGIILGTICASAIVAVTPEEK